MCRFLSCQIWEVFSYYFFKHFFSPTLIVLSSGHVNGTGTGTGNVNVRSFVRGPQGTWGSVPLFFFSLFLSGFSDWVVSVVLSSSPLIISSSFLFCFWDHPLSFLFLLVFSFKSHAVLYNIFVCWDSDFFSAEVSFFFFHLSVLVIVETFLQDCFNVYQMILTSLIPMLVSIFFFFFVIQFEVFLVLGFSIETCTFSYFILKLWLLPKPSVSALFDTALAREGRWSCCLITARWR